MKPVTKIQFFDENGEKFFGEGPCRLLEKVEETGSLRCAAASMEMAYSKALKLVKQAEKALGFPLTQRSVGGRDGGGSSLTPEGRAFLMQYEAYRDACIQTNRELYAQYFPGKTVGCVIMASGMGKRFGGNKLMADFCGAPLIANALALAALPLLACRIVVTRSEEVEALCNAQGVPVLRHAQPYRSDTVRLGLAALLGKEPALRGCLFLPGDQPLLTQQSVEALALAAAPDAIVRLCAADGTPGSPVLFGADYFSELLHLPDGRGGNAVARAHPGSVRLVSARNDAELRDVDTRDDLNQLRQLTNR